MEMLRHTVQSAWDLLLEMAPYLLLGFFLAGVLSVVVSSEKVARFLGKPGFWSAVKAAAIGVPLPLCSCGVIPTGISFYKNGAGKGATNAFLISTPQTGADSILLTYMVMGPVWAVARPVIALVTGVFGGVLTDRIDAGTPMTITDSGIKAARKPVWPVAVLRYAFIDFLSDISRPLIVGILLAVLITVAIPPDFFTTYLQYPVLNMFIVLLISVPLYVCATGSIPIAMALLVAGVSPGAVLVFLMAGPATNITTMTVLWKTMGRKSTLVYLFSIIAGAMFFGILIDYALPAHLFSVSGPRPGAGHHHGDGWLAILSAIALIGLILYAELKKIFPSKLKVAMESKQFKVEGMTCNHCKNAVEQSVQQLEGVTSAVAVPAENKLIVEGHADASAIKTAVEKLGYRFGEL